MSVLNLLHCCFCLKVWFFGLEACVILAPWPGVEPPTRALEGKNLTHWNLPRASPHAWELLLLTFWQAPTGCHDSKATSIQICSSPLILDLTFQIQTLVLSGIPCKHCFPSISQILAYLFLLCLDIFDEQITCAYRKRLREKAVLHKAPCDTQHAHPIIFCICLIFSFFFFQLEDNLLYRLLYRFLL